MRGIIAPMVTSHGLPVFEPFTGGANLADLWPPGSVCSDIDQDNVRLYAHVQANGVGWIPDDGEIPKPRYLEALARMRSKDATLLDTFYLIACSFRGRKGSGYAAPHPAQKRVSQGRNGLKRLQGIHVTFTALDFFEVEPRPGFALYCDPPYRESTGYRAQGNGAFDHDRFDARAREWAKVAPVYVTEYVAREGWLEVGSKRPTPGRLATKTDRLFRVLL